MYIIDSLKRNEWAPIAHMCAIGMCANGTLPFPIDQFSLRFQIDSSIMDTSLRLTTPIVDAP